MTVPDSNVAHHEMIGHACSQHGLTYQLQESRGSGQRGEVKSLRKYLSPAWSIVRPDVLVCCLGQGLVLAAPAIDMTRFWMSELSAEEREQASTSGTLLFKHDYDAVSRLGFRV